MKLDSQSWKTTLFGILGGIGAGIVSAMAAGIIDPTHLPVWLKDVAALCAIAGHVGLGTSARDNDKSSEDVGAKPPGPAAGIGTIGSLLLCAVLCLGTTGCGTTPATKAAQADQIVITAVNDIMAEWRTFVNAGKATPAQIAQVETVYNGYYKAQMVLRGVLERSAANDPATAPTAAEIATAKSASDQAQVALLDLLRLLLQKNRTSGDVRDLRWSRAYATLPQPKGNGDISEKRAGRVTRACRLEVF